MTDRISAILGEPVTSHVTKTGVEYVAANGNRFFLFNTSSASAEHIAGCLRRG